jgi:phosphatidylserine decarboxylase
MFARTVAAQLFLWLQRLVPKHLLTSVLGVVAEIRWQPFKNLLIRAFVKVYDVDIGEAARAVPDGYADFNAFFTRELADGARTIDPSPAALVSPVDGIASAAGHMDGPHLLQAKGLYYSLEDLLATDIADATSFAGGAFATFYLAPYHYHRVHSPLAGTLSAVRYVPGDLFSVNQVTVERLPGLFARNERLICHFRTTAGPMVLVFVGAMNVGSISTPWTGRVRPRKRGVVEDLTPDPARGRLDVAKGQLLGWFNLGSTVIVLLPPGACAWRDDLAQGRRVRMGEPIGRLR